MDLQASEGQVVAAGRRASDAHSLHFDWAIHHLHALHCQCTLSILRSRPAGDQHTTCTLRHLALHPGWFGQPAIWTSALLLLLLLRCQRRGLSAACHACRAQEGSRSQRQASQQLAQRHGEAVRTFGAPNSRMAKRSPVPTKRTSSTEPQKPNSCLSCSQHELNQRLSMLKKAPAVFRAKSSLLLLQPAAAPGMHLPGASWPGSCRNPQHSVEAN